MGARHVFGYSVEREAIGDDGDFNLSGERYRPENDEQFEIPRVPIGEICTLNPPKREVRDLPGDTVVSFVPMADLREWEISFRASETKALEEVGNSYTYFADNDVLLAKVTPCFENGKAGIAKGLESGIGFGSSEFYVLRTGEEVLPEWVYRCVTHEAFRAQAIPQMTGTGGLQRVPRAFVERFKIPVPPLEVQREIVAEIEGYQRVIDGARAVIDNYRPHIPIDPEWGFKPIGSVAQVASGYGFPVDQQGLTDEEIPFLKVSDMNLSGNETFIRNWNNTISEKTLLELKAKAFPEGTVIFPKIGAAIATNKKRILTKRSAFDNNVMGIVADGAELSATFLYYWLLSFDLSNWASSAQPPSMRKSVVENQEIPLPSLEIQEAVVKELDAEQAIIDGNRDLITRFEKKIDAAIARVWGEARADEGAA